MNRVDVHRLLPLRPPALLLDEIQDFDDDFLRGRGSVPRGSPFAEQGSVPAHIAIEVAAQAAGAHVQLRRTGEESAAPPGEGYLVLLREVSILRENFAVDTPLDVTVELDTVAPPLGIYRFEISDRAGSLARGTLGVYVPSGQASRKQNH